MTPPPSTMAATTTSAQPGLTPEGRRAQWAALRAEVRARHASQLLAQRLVPDSPTASRPRIRHSPLWTRYAPDRGHPSPSSVPPSAPSDEVQEESLQPESAERAYSTLGPNFIPEEESVRNDYSQNFVDTLCSSLPGGAVRNASLQGRFAEYPKLRKLLEMQRQLVRQYAHPPTYATADLRSSLLRPPPPGDGPASFHLGALLPVKYDVVLIDPPLETYHWESLPTARSVFPQQMPVDEEPPRFPEDQFWSWEQLAALPIPQLAAKESFVFLWVGTGAADGLERGRELLAKWGFRRCEDIVCISVESDSESSHDSEPGSSMRFNTSGLKRTIQHCLMGIRGTVRRSVDTNFVHCNIDTDVILWSPPRPEVEGGDKLASDLGVAQSIRSKMHSKPPELYTLIENFCQGTRRIELFGTNDNLRPGWLTVGQSLGPDAPGWPGPRQEEEPEPKTEAEISAALQSGQGAGLPTHRRTAHMTQDPRPYIKAEYDAYFAVDPPGCELKDRANVLPYDPVIDTLRPKSPPPRGAKATPVLGSGPVPALSQASPGPGRPRVQTLPPAPGGARLPARPTFAAPSNFHPGLAPPHQFAPGAGYAPVPLGGAGLSGLGAGGARTVSVPSGSDTLSGPQASVLGLRTPSALGAPHGLGRRS